MLLFCSFCAMKVSRICPEADLMNALANFLVPSVQYHAAHHARDGSDAIAIGCLVDARVRQLRQLCNARGGFEIDPSEEAGAVDDGGVSLWFDRDNRQWRTCLNAPGELRD
jgi:hypothetical protein